VTAYTIDRFLGGAIAVRQPVDGFRAGLDAVMLAAAVPAKRNDEALELGAGAGTASLCLASRVRDCTVAGAEIDTALAALANENARENGMQGRVAFFECDVLSAALRGDYDHVFANPPFHHASGQSSPHAGRARAKQDNGQLAEWVRVGLKRTRSGGTFTVIVRADRLAEVLGVSPEDGVTIFPLWPKQGQEAKRVIVQAAKGSLAALRVAAGLVLHEADGRYTREADAVLRGEASLDL
jgi:tRNA1Val (adenine37-N6)-methyltransferase